MKSEKNLMVQNIAYNFEDNKYDENPSRLDPDCESYFYYGGVGDINHSRDPEETHAAEITIDALGFKQ
jgi:hypothetical protein